MAAKEHPILFRGPMVRAILEDRKTQTRRVVKPQPLHDIEIPEEGFVGISNNGFSCGRTRKLCGYSEFGEGQVSVEVVEFPVKPRWTVGDRMWVRETFTEYDGQAYADGQSDPVFVYRADQSEESLRIAEEGNVIWRPSIHMPRWASRITLEITDVRVQRVQEISEEDALAEGAMHWWNSLSRFEKKRIYSGGFGPLTAFCDLWDSINAERGYGLDTNPWVWAISFRRVIAASTEEA